MRRRQMRAFWDCGDSGIIEYAIMRARLNDREKKVLIKTMDECKTQEEIAEEMYLSVRAVQGLWYDAQRKIMSLDWVKAYSNELIMREKGR